MYEAHGIRLCSSVKSESEKVLRNLHRALYIFFFVQNRARSHASISVESRPHQMIRFIGKSRICFMRV